MNGKECMVWLANHWYKFCEEFTVQSHSDAVVMKEKVMTHLYEDVSSEFIANVGVDGDGRRSALDLRLSDHFVVNGNRENERKKSETDRNESSHRRKRRRWDDDGGD